MAEPHTARWTVADLEALPDEEGTRYELVDGELYVSTQPNLEHQDTCLQCGYALETWNRQDRRGRVLIAPGVIFSDTDAAAPDLVWISHDRVARLRDAAGHLQGAPELIVEVLSPGAANERRDREIKLRQFSRYGVDEYWILDWRTRSVTVYRQVTGALTLVATLTAVDTLTSPTLPGFSSPVSSLFPSG